MYQANITRKDTADTSSSLLPAVSELAMIKCKLIAIALFCNVGSFLLF